MSLSAAWSNYAQQLDGDPQAQAEAQEEVESSLFSGWSTKDQSLLGGLSHRQRLAGFVLMLMAAAICFALEISMMFVGLAVLRPRKFALLHSMGSLCGILCFAMLRGPWAHLQHLFSRERAPFSAVYLSALLATLYFAFKGLTILTLVCAGIQIAALLWYVLSYVPGGTTGLLVTTKLAMRSIFTVGRSLLPV
eukprot:comp16924_c0_seq1/m.15486 comp16924_c0_seq1/g.15486  ORF comp16924_c0_seq1/g.15486 comp16924_c0_seq1/m.15486 type:complete len:193 (-) comp16924_c0_seq1:66-644(-)